MPKDIILDNWKKDHKFAYVKRHNGDGARYLGIAKPPDPNRPKGDRSYNYAKPKLVDKYGYPVNRDHAGSSADPTHTVPWDDTGSLPAGPHMSNFGSGSVYGDMPRGPAMSNLGGGPMYSNLPSGPPMSDYGGSFVNGNLPSGPPMSDYGGGFVHGGAPGGPGYGRTQSHAGYPIMTAVAPYQGGLAPPQNPTYAIGAPQSDYGGQASGYGGHGSAYGGQRANGYNVVVMEPRNGN
ncbi:hypothetical protein M011DRAFT_491072 [Sporormia fimetaria CBS 119925]|uniref:Uncharacterized protein n=1 Tax=Sporormia fimetaria CBS 119925 TaxID=1340428 RepID=A0A6A6UXH6_9PLEO|nr:hypothetical protein M011DRAFT_491072 [Sporormia fimetaria CBS 119925]